MTPRRRALAIAGVASFLALGIWAFLQPAERPLPVPPPPPSKPLTERLRAVQAEEPITPRTAGLDAVPRMGNLADRAAADYRERARFPPWSRPLPEGRDPIAEDREVIPARSLPTNLVPGLVIRTARTGFVRPEPVTVLASMGGDDGAVAPATLRGEVRDARDALVATLRFHDDGQGPDAAAGDLEYTAQITPPVGDGAADSETGPDPGWRGAYLVSVSATTPTGELRAATTGFLYSAPLGALTGRFRDEVVDGNFRIAAELEVTRASRFHVEGTLSDAKGAPLAWGQNAGPLPPGRHWFPLTFCGLALREAGRDGPYTLRSVALTTVDGIPNQKSPLLQDAHTTRRYEALDFHGEAFEDPALLDAASSLERR